MKITVTAESPKTITLAGKIDEHFEAGVKQIVEHVKGLDKIIFNIGGIDSINSTGAMHWINMVKSDLASTSIQFEDCPMIFIDYLNMVPDIAANNELLSIQAPYVCDDCGHSFTATNSMAELRELEGFPKAPCPACNAQADCTEEIEDYLSFLDT